MAEFFIRRPTVAIVISIVLVILGVVSFTKLPVEQYPSVSPPMIRIETTYPGAGAEVVEQSVATPIEQQVNGVDNSIYMKSLNTSDGRLQLDVSFQVDMDLDTANVLTQNRVSQAQSRLPQDVIKQGVTVKKINPSILMAVSLYSPRSTYDALFLNNYAMINVRDAILRVKGVASVDLIGGAEYGMRIWLDPQRLGELGLQPSDVIKAIQEQNLQAPAGQVGGPPSLPGQQNTYTIKAPSRLTTPEEFGEILIRTTGEGAQVRLKDVGRAELGGEFYKAFGRLSIPRPPEKGEPTLLGGPAAILAVYLLPGANQIESANGIYDTLKEQSKFFPPDLEYLVTYDTTPAVTESIVEVEHTFVEALILVILVVIVFLQKVRATIIPLLTIPVSILGTFAFFPLIGFSVNTLSLFGLVLAIGIVVDDAIVVVEAVMHHIEHGMQPREATVKAMKEVTAPVIGIALVLSAVFIPVAGLGGLTGRLYRQFALTIAISVLISAFNALSLSPALCAMFLKPADAKSTGVLAVLTAPIRKLFGLLFGGFNKVFDVTTKGYVAVSSILIRKSLLSLGIVALAVVGTARLAGKTAKAFVPDEDQGLFLVNVQLPPASSLEKTDAACRSVEQILWETPGIESFNTVGGLAFLNNTFGSDKASFLVRLRPWHERKAKDLNAMAILDVLKRRLHLEMPEAVAFPFLPPTLPGFGAAGGFTAYLQDRSGTLDVQQLGEYGGVFLKALAARPEVSSPFTAFNPRVPQVGVEIDREKARTLGVPIDQVFSALQACFGGAYVNDFNRFGRLYRVYVQADAPFRAKPEDIAALKVRSTTTGEMVPLGTVLRIDPSVPGAELTCRFNLFRSIEVSGSNATGYSSGQAMDAVEKVAHDTLPREMQIAWAGLSYQEKTAPSPVPTFIMAVVFVFLLLAAMYESWGLPIAVLLGTPFVALGAFTGVRMGNFTNNVFVQIGLVMLIGLAAKNSILIVEFAKMKRDEGMSARDSAIEAARLRFRPILMTAFAFILGVVPLMRASGSGAASRTVMGTAVFWGMLIATALGVFATPAFYTFVEWFRRGKKKAPAAAAGAPASGHGPTPPAEHGPKGSH